MSLLQTANEAFPFTSVDEPSTLPSLHLVINTEAPATGAPAPAAAPARKEPGLVPERDAQGLPIPGTMADTAHTEAVRRATGGVRLDPASVQRQLEQQLKDMHCKERDGVTTCD